MEDFVSAPWLRRLIAAVVLAGLVVLGFRVLEPFIVPLVWACILAFVSWPAHARLLRLCRGRSTVASLLTTTAVSLAVIAPLAWLAVVLSVVRLLCVCSVGERVARALARALGQLRGPRVHAYLGAIGQTVKAVVSALVRAAVVQGVLAGLGYWICGATAPVFLAALTTV